VVGFGGPDSSLTTGVDMTAVLRRVLSGVRLAMLLFSPVETPCSKGAAVNKGSSRCCMKSDGR
jgi:hypothetical protein